MAAVKFLWVQLRCSRVWKVAGGCALGPRRKEDVMNLKRTYAIDRWDSSLLYFSGPCICLFILWCVNIEPKKATLRFGESWSRRVVCMDPAEGASVAARKRIRISNKAAGVSSGSIFFKKNAGAEKRVQSRTLMTSEISLRCSLVASLSQPQSSYHAHTYAIRIVERFGTLGCDSNPSYDNGGTYIAFLYHNLLIFRYLYWSKGWRLPCSP